MVCKLLGRRNAGHLRQGRVRTRAADHENAVATHEVSIGGYEGNNVRISDGLQQGDIVVVGGVNKLAEDQNVRLEAGVSQ